MTLTHRGTAARIAIVTMCAGMLLTGCGGFGNSSITENSTKTSTSDSVSTSTRSESSQPSSEKLSDDSASSTAAEEHEDEKPSPAPSQSGAGIPRIGQSCPGQEGERSRAVSGQYLQCRLVAGAPVWSVAEDASTLVPQAPGSSPEDADAPYSPIPPETPSTSAPTDTNDSDDRLGNGNGRDNGNGNNGDNNGVKPDTGNSDDNRDSAEIESPVSAPLFAPETNQPMSPVAPGQAKKQAGQQSAVEFAPSRKTS